jgi:hypothetical protein
MDGVELDSGPCELLPPTVTLSVAKVRRGNYIFITWKGDHGPRHVHVYKDARLIVKWDLEADLPMKGRASARVVELIRTLRAEGIL